MKIISFINPVKKTKNDLPKSYLEFIGKYGYGTYCGLINIIEPDEQVIYNTFSDYDFWKFNTKFTNQDLKKAIQLASTIDGDIICSVKNKVDTLFVLPRNSETILNFKTLNEILLFYKESYQIPESYFEPSLERKVEVFSLIQNEKLLSIEVIHNNFLKDFKYDFIIGKEQPKYVITKIGGWVKFDLVYKNSITISYQLIENLDNEYTKYLDYIKKEIKQLATV